jgi:hypothetical protein
VPTVTEKIPYEATLDCSRMLRLLYVLSQSESNLVLRSSLEWGCAQKVKFPARHNEQYSTNTRRQACYHSQIHNIIRL